MAAAPAPWGGNRVQQCWCFQPVGQASQEGRCRWGLCPEDQHGTRRPGVSSSPTLRRLLGRMSSRPLQPLSPGSTQEVLLQGLPDGAAGENKEFLKMRERWCPYRWQKQSAFLQQQLQPPEDRQRSEKSRCEEAGGSYTADSCDHSWRICIYHPQVRLADTSAAPARLLVLPVLSLWIARKLLMTQELVLSIRVFITHKILWNFFHK